MLSGEEKTLWESYGKTYAQIILTCCDFDSAWLTLLVCSPTEKCSLHLHACCVIIIYWSLKVCAFLRIVCPRIVFLNPIGYTRPFQWFSAFLLIADCQNPQPVHPGGWVRGARTHLLHPQDPGSLEAEARCPDRGQYSADGHQVLFPCHLPLQPVQHLAGYHRRPRATAPRIPEEGVIGVECSTTRVIEVTVYVTVCLRACRNMDCEERVQGPAGCSIPLRVMLWQKAV